jgi:ADP-heptose:LPS heptosyltransferase
MLVARTDNRGDVVMAGPALRALANAAPDAHVTLLVSPGGAEAAELLPWHDAVWTERVTWQDTGADTPFRPARERAFVRRLTAGRFDAVVILTSFSQSAYPLAYAAYLAGIPYRIGFGELFGGAVLSHPATPPARDTNQTDRNLALLQATGVPVVDRRLEVRIPPRARVAARSLLAEMGVPPQRPYLVAAPAASCEARRYPIGPFAEALRHVVETSGMPAVVIGSQADIGLASRLTDAVPGTRSLAGRTTFAQAAAVIAGARLLIGSHSGPMHLAAATGVPGVIAFSGTDLPEQWVRPMDGVQTLTVDVPCAPCGRFTCPIGLPCLSIAPSALADAARGAMRTREPELWIATAS